MLAGYFYFTLSVLVVVAFTSGLCLAAYLVSRRRIYGLASIAFVVYFLDVAEVFRVDFVGSATQGAFDAGFYAPDNPLESLVIGATLVGVLWLAVSEYLHADPAPSVGWPVSTFFALSAAVLLFVPQDSWRLFLFYSVRSLMVFFMLVLAAVLFTRTADPIERRRLARHRRFFTIICILSLLPVAENVVVMLIMGPEPFSGAGIPSFPNRNLMENILVLACAIYTTRRIVRALKARADAPIQAGENANRSFVEEHIVYYGHKYGLTARECEVLTMVLKGHDNRAIAGALYLAVSTIKVHVHNILKKTETSNRAELINDFWKAC